MTLIALIYTDQNIARNAKIAKESKIEKLSPRSFSAILTILGDFGNYLIRVHPW